MTDEHPELPGNPSERWQLKKRLDLALERRDAATETWAMAQAELVDALHAADQSRAVRMREAVRMAEEQVRQHTNDEFAIRSQWHALDMKELSEQANGTAASLKWATWVLAAATIVLACATVALIFATMNA